MMSSCLKIIQEKNTSALQLSNAKLTNRFRSRIESILHKPTRLKSLTQFNKKVNKGSKIIETSFAKRKADNTKTWNIISNVSRN